MNEQISMVSLIAEATTVVQLVMAILLAASVLSWVVIFQRNLVLNNAKRVLRNFQDQFWSGMDLHVYFQEVRDYQDSDTGVENVFVDGYKEYSRLSQQGAAPTAIMQGVERVMRVAITREEEVLTKNLPFLASIGSISPYIGLFGTVWGIMHAFLGLASSTQVNTINSVAPGIAEALVATAMGLFAAIPAVLAYNHFSSRAQRLLFNYEAIADEFSSILHRRVFSEV